MSKHQYLWGGLNLQVMENESTGVELSGTRKCRYELSGTRKCRYRCKSGICRYWKMQVLEIAGTGICTVFPRSFRSPAILATEVQRLRNGLRIRSPKKKIYVSTDIRIKQVTARFLAGN